MKKPSKINKNSPRIFQISGSEFREFRKRIDELNFKHPLRLQELFFVNRYKREKDNFRNN